MGRESFIYHMWKERECLHLLDRGYVRMKNLYSIKTIPNYVINIDVNKYRHIWALSLLMFINHKGEKNNFIVEKPSTY